jgi:hypothetical protein
LRFPFSSSITTPRVTVEVFDPASTRVNRQLLLAPRYIDSGRTTAQKTSVAQKWIDANHIANPSCGTAAPVLLLRSCIVGVAYSLVLLILLRALPRRSLAVGLHVTIQINKSKSKPVQKYTKISR